MTRAEFIHRAIIEGMRRNAEDGEPVGSGTLLAWAYGLADAIEKDGKAPWDNNTVALKPKGGLCVCGVPLVGFECHNEDHARDEPSEHTNIEPPKKTDNEHAALLGVESAARSLRDHVGYETGATSRELNVALGRLDTIRRGPILT
jgi:hypothetical protein